MTSRPNCEACKWSSNPFPEASAGPDDLLECEWPAALLPYSLRWGNRERVMVARNDPPAGQTCTQFQSKEGQNNA